MNETRSDNGDLRDSRVARNAESVKQKNSEVVDESDRKAAQFAIIRDSNAADDGYHTWIRSAAEIKTLSETLADPEWAEYDEYDPDYTRQMAEDAVRTGKITVYSSYKIGNGVFVTPSRMEAESYSGKGKVYSKTVNVADVAWIDPTQDFECRDRPEAPFRRPGHSLQRPLHAPQSNTPRRAFRRSCLDFEG